MVKKKNLFDEMRQNFEQDNKEIEESMMGVLEEICWKDGKYQNKEGKEVNLKPIGEQIKISIETSQRTGLIVSFKNPYVLFCEQLIYRLIDLQKNDEKYKEVNAFVKKRYSTFYPYQEFSVNFYKMIYFFNNNSKGNLLDK